MIEAYILILFVIVTYIVGRAIGYEQAKKRDKHQMFLNRNRLIRKGKEL